MNKQRLFEFVANGVREQVESSAHAVDPERLAPLPIAAQTVYWLWRFQCEAGVCGMDVFVLDSVGVFSPQIHAALQEVGAAELAHLLEAAIPLAREGPAEFKRLPDQSWFDQFPLTEEFSELQFVSDTAFPLVRALTDLVAAYVRSNGAVLFEG